MSFSYKEVRKVKKAGNSAIVWGAIAVGAVVVVAIVTPNPKPRFGRIW